MSGSGPPPGSGACCPPAAQGLTYLRVEPRGASVGLFGLETVFQQLWVLGRRPEQASDQELVGMVRKSNYIPPKASVEADYAVALRQAYAEFCRNQERSRDRDRG